MFGTVGDLKKEWIESNGETDGLEVAIDGNEYPNKRLYEGSFKNIPEELLDKEIFGIWKVIDSSVPERIGAYSLSV